MEILNTVLNMSITGSIIFFIFLLIKPLTKKHFNSSWHYKMLILILSFFILPVGNFIKLPIKPISNISQISTQGSRNLDNVIRKEEIKDVQKTDNIEEQKTEIIDKIKDQNPKAIDTKNYIPNEINFNIDSYIDIIKYIWIVCIIVLLLLKIIPYIRFKSAILKKSIEVGDKDILELFNLCKDKLNINSRIHLRICDTIGSPMLIGVFHPIVLIPNSNEDYKRLKMIFLHELNHYKRKDIIVKFFGLIINAVHWFNPIIYILLKEMDKYIEYSIDEKVVEKMDISDRKYYGETILNLIGNSMTKKNSFTTAMGSNGNQLKSRLENMIFSFKISRKKHIVSLFVSVLMLILGITVACSILPNKTIEENNPFVVYIKEDGLYYSYLNGGEEIKIHEGKEFIYPLISRGGRYIAYTKGKGFYIYDIKNKEYEEIADNMEHYYISYDWLDDDTIVYSTDNPGFTIYNVDTKIKKEHLDEFYYDNLRAANKDTIYGIKMSKWTSEGTDYAANNGVVEINLKDYDLKNKVFSINTIIKSRETTDEMIGYNPIIWDITEDGKYIYIMEKPASGSLSTDGIGIGIYDVEKKEHIEFTDITTLAYKNHLSINPKNNNLIGLIEGGYREMILNKEIVLLTIDEDKTYKTIKFMDKDLVAMTPSFTLDGEKLLYSATKNLEDFRATDFTKVYNEWESQPHNIYEYNMKTSSVKKITEGEHFDFMPISISEDSILFSRYKGNDCYSLIKLTNGKENVIVDNIIFSGGSDNYPFGLYGHIDTEKGMDIFLNTKEVYSDKEKDESQNIMNELYKLKGTKIGNNSKVGNILNLLDFPEELTPSGMELFTKEEPYGLQVNFKAHAETQMKYIAMSSDYIWRAQSLILFSLIDNLDYIKYSIDSGDGNIVVSYITREVTDSLTMSTLGYRISEIAKNKKRFKKFYEILIENSMEENQPEGLVGYIVIKDNTLYFNEVEIVEWEDKARVKELGLNEYDMPNGYMIINKNKSERTFELADEVIFTFTDVNLDFVKNSNIQFNLNV
ncbi:M56 family metallopeptidase [Tissierella praeacuta]|uniref:M56 family metallopeptidase n=1 Tax=Tissierella praeacuta TaxID=43131 RepID=UPI003516DEB7